MSGRGTIAGVIGELEADALRYGRHVTEMLADGARAAGAEELEYARLRQAIVAVARGDDARAADIRRIRALEDMAVHLRHIERSLEAGVRAGDPVRLAAALALAVAAVATRDAAALRRLDREISLILDEVGLTARARCLAMHVLAVGEAAHAFDPTDALLRADGAR
jgi:hypothetical protein